MPAKPGFYEHKARPIVSRQISTAVASEITGPRSLQWISRAAPSLPSTLSDESTAAQFYANYPDPLDDVDDVVPLLLPFDETTTAQILQAGLPGITVRHVPNRYPNSVRV